MPVLRKSSGAFDLPSIITGVVVVGILAAGVLAAIFGVIPFAQDRGAKQDLSSIRTAEGVAKAKDNRFMDHQRLLDIGYLQLSSTEKTKVKADAKGTCYVGIAKSGTGTLFYSTDANTDPAILEADTVTGCLTEVELAELIEETGGIDTPKGAPENLKITAISPLQAKASWTVVKGASGYKVEYRTGDGDWITKYEKTIGTTASVNALPEETVTIRVSSMKAGQLSEASTASVRLPDSVLKNPSFEEDWQSWTRVATNAAVGSEKAHTGTKSLRAWTSSGNQTAGATQTVTIPVSTPVLTYWSTAPAQITVSGTKLPSTAAASAAAEDGWVQYEVDVSAYTGKVVALNVVNTVTGNTYVDDISFGSPVEPGTPGAVVASSRLGQATATWTNPLFSGGAPVTGYTVTAWLDGVEKGRSNVAGNLRQATVDGLKIGNSYTFTVVATNDVGSSTPSQHYGPVEILAGHISNPGFEQGSVAWTLNGSASAAGDLTHSGSKALSITYNKQTATTASQTIAVPSDAVVLTYWATSDAAKVTVGNSTQKQARAASGEGGWNKYKIDVSSFAGKTVSLSFQTDGAAYRLDDIALESAMAPNAPTNVVASSRLETATVTWVAPAFIGGTPITSYTATAWLNGDKQDSVTVDQGKRSATLSNVKVGVNYTFTVSARNAFGESVPSTVYGPVEITTGAFANASFENEKAGWESSGDAASISMVARTGQYSLQGKGMYAGLNQVVSVPADATSMTFWGKGTPLIKSGSYANATLVAVAGETVDGWTKYSVSAAKYQGKTQGFWFGGGGIYDDIAIE